MKRIVAFILAVSFGIKVFAAETVPLNVRDFGAKGDGLVKDTAAIQKALDTCAAAGGGTVLVPEGLYLTGSLTLGANTTLQLASHTSLIGSPDIADFPLVTIRWEGEFREGHRALISATNAENITITGGGSIFGPPISLSHLRNPRGPALIELTGCTNALLENFTTQYQQLWSIHLLYCNDFTATNLTIRTVNANGDGLDVDSCDGVTIEHCDINTGDDAISLKSGRGLAAQQLGRPTQNVVIRDCRLQSSIYAALGLGTEMSGGIRNVKIQNCVISGRQNAIFIKSRDGRGGYMENISGENITVLKSPTFIGIDLLKKGIQATDPVPGEVEKWPRVHNLSFKNIRVQDVTDLIDGTNIPLARPVDGLTLTDISGTCLRAISLANMTNVNLSAINVTGFSGALVRTENVQGTGLGKTAQN
jgi:polygalacturonase